MATCVDIRVATRVDIRVATRVDIRVGCRAWSAWISYLVRMKLLTAYSFRAERVALTLGAVMTVLVVIHVLAMQANFNPALGLKERLGFEYWHVAFFDLDEEESFGTWFSSGILMMAAALLVHQAGVVRAQGAAWHRWWLVLGVELPVLVAVGARPVPGLVTPFIGKAHGNAVTGKGPELLDQPIVVLARPFPGQERLDLVAAVQELGAIAPLAA